MRKHEKRLRKAMRQLRRRDIQITIIRKKCKNNKQKLSFFNYLFSADDILAVSFENQVIDPAISSTNTSKLKLFLGITNYI